MLISGRRWEQRHSFQLALFVRLLVTLGMVPVCIACGVWLATMWEMFPQIRRLTNLMQLTVDTSYWTKYRSRTKNPDFGDTFAPAIPGLLKGQFPAIPRDGGDLTPDDHIQAIANTAAFHFAFIEQGGTSLYPSLAQHNFDISFETRQ